MLFVEKNSSIRRPTIVAVQLGLGILSVLYSPYSSACDAAWDKAGALNVEAHRQFEAKNYFEAKLAYERVANAWGQASGVCNSTNSQKAANNRQTALRNVETSQKNLCNSEYTNVHRMALSDSTDLYENSELAVKDRERKLVERVAQSVKLNVNWEKIAASCDEILIKDPIKPPNSEGKEYLWAKRSSKDASDRSQKFKATRESELADFRKRSVEKVSCKVRDDRFNKAFRNTILESDKAAPIDNVYRVALEEALEQAYWVKNSCPKTQNTSLSIALLRESKVVAKDDKCFAKIKGVLTGAINILEGEIDTAICRSEFGRELLQETITEETLAAVKKVLAEPKK
jgi:hypothetical protein